MRALDFDNTIYDGESPLDFYLFSIRYNPRVLRFIAPVIFHLVRYRRSRSSRADIERAIRRYIHAYLTSFDDIPAMVSAFWDTHMHKIRPWYEPRPDDVIMTASFNYTMEEVMRRLGLAEADKTSMLMVGDRKYDVLGAAECGLPCVGVEFFGYAAPGELAQAGAAAVVHTAAELEAYILTH